MSSQNSLSDVFFRQIRLLESLLSGIPYYRIIIVVIPAIMTAMLWSCSPSSPEKELQVLLETDRAFSKLSVEKGATEAFLYFMADDGKTLPKFGHPRSKEFYRKMLENEREPGENELKWEPIEGEISYSGDLGYTFGKYEYSWKDSLDTKTSFGYYVTIWKKQADGIWRFILDAGNESPPLR